jgi:hypothetical protein
VGIVSFVSYNHRLLCERVFLCLHHNQKSSLAALSRELHVTPRTIQNAVQRMRGLSPRLARQILAVCNSYNERASSSDLPLWNWVSASDTPTYSMDGDSHIMISRALNLSDRPSGCTKLATRMLAKQKSHFSVFLFLNTMEGASTEELHEFLARYNRPPTCLRRSV